MNDADKRYLRLIRKTRPSLEVFERMVRILRSVQDKTDKMLHASLSKTLL